jgi:hypothetical protein
MHFFGCLAIVPIKQQLIEQPTVNLLISFDTKSESDTKSGASQPLNANIQALKSEAKALLTP